jgi:hypothetical protein
MLVAKEPVMNITLDAIRATERFSVLEPATVKHSLSFLFMIVRISKAITDTEKQIYVISAFTEIMVTVFV